MRMQRKILVREIYFYIVCLIALIIFIVGLTGLGGGIVNYIKPSTYVTKANIMPGYREQYRDLTEEELNAMADQEIQSSIDNERGYALRTLINDSIMIIISIPLFIFHWRKAQQLWKLEKSET